MTGHYRFFAYTDAARALADTSSDGQPDWAQDTPGLVCSSAVWAAMFQSEQFVMEGDMGEGRPGEDITDTDGLYFYDEEERTNAAFEYEAAVLEKVVARGELLPFLFGSPEYYSAQMLNCFAFDRCERPDAFQSDLNDWESPGTGTAVSPNSIRRRAGAVCGTRAVPPVAPVRRDEALDAAALVQATALIDTGLFAHRPQGQSPRQRVVAAGFGGTYRGEALAKDARSVAAALDAWWASPGHCRTLMDARADSIGVSVVNRRFRRGPWLSYWVVVMGANEGEGAK